MFQHETVFYKELNFSDESNLQEKPVGTILQFYQRKERKGGKLIRVGINNIIELQNYSSVRRQREEYSPIFVHPQEARRALVKGSACPRTPSIF